MGRLTYYQIYNHRWHCILPALQKHQHMLRKLKKILPQSLPIFKEHPGSSQDTNRLEPQSQPVPDNTDHSVYQDTEQPREEYLNNYRPHLEDIPELEDDEENWEEGQSADADFIDHHNTTEESDGIHREYSAHFEKVTDQGYSSQNNRMPGLEYYIPEPEYYNSDTRPKQYQRHQNPNIYLPPPPSTEDLWQWHG